MEIFPSIKNQILELLPEDWPEIREAVGKFSGSRPEVWKLPLKGYEAVREREVNLDDLCAAFACSYMAIMLVDDMLDADDRGFHHQVGEAQAANLAVVLNACSGRIVREMEVDPAIKLRIVDCLQNMIIETGYGQYLDSRNLRSEENYWRVIRQKSVPFFSAALQTGAILAGIDPDQIENLQLVGRSYGEILQIHDDLRDCFQMPAAPDWRMGRNALPILFASTVDHPQKAEFLELIDAVEDPAKLQQAQQILLKCGAVSYCIHEIMKRSGEILELIPSMPGFRTEVLNALFAGFVKPVRELLDRIGIDPEYYQLVQLA